MIQNRKFYHLSRLFRDEDLDAFRDFLCSPFHNKSRVLITFWDHWRKKILEGEEGGKLSPAAFLAGTGLRSSRFNNMCSEIHLLGKKFLSLQEYRQREPLQQQLTAAAILNRDPLIQHYDKFLEPIYRKLSETKASPETYLTNFLTQSEYVQTLIFARRTDVNWSELFRSLQTNLDAFYHSKKLQIQTGAANSGLVIQIGSADGESAGEPKEQDIVSQIYSRIYAVQTGNADLETFYHTFEFLQDKRNEVERRLLFDMYTNLLNFCVRQINAGNNQFEGACFTMYVALLEENLLLIDGKLSPQHFKNIITLGARNNRIGTVRKLLERFGEKLPESHRMLILAYCESVVLFYERKYSEVIARLGSLKLKGESDIFWGLDARVYWWKSYYEDFPNLNAEQLDEMDRHYHSFRLYIQRNKRMSELQKLQYANFIRLFQRLVNLKVSPTKGRKRILLNMKDELAEIAHLHNKRWLIEKVDSELEGLPN